MSATYETTMQSPMGWLNLRASDEGLTHLAFAEGPGEVNDDHAVLRQAATEMAEYFAGTRREFNVPLSPEGTPFQHRVWDALLRIPCSQTRTYLDIARSLGDANAVRAVGGANGSNPIAIIVPCHRVIASDGTLHGYTGGLDRKRWLLEHEGASVVSHKQGLFAAKVGA